MARPASAAARTPDKLGLVYARQHPLTFLRDELVARRIVTCIEAMEARDGRRLEAAGLVLVRQRPGSAKGVILITIKDETGVANLIVWPKVFEEFRRVVMGGSMIAARGYIQREGEVVHLVATQMIDLSAELATVGSRNGAFPLQHGRGDQVTHAGGGPDPRELPPKGWWTRDIYVPDLRPGSGIVPGQRTEGIKVKPRDFR